MMKTKTAKIKRPLRLTDDDRLDQLRAFVGLCYVILLSDTDGDYKEMANITGLSIGTLYRLAYEENVSLKIHVGTLQLLAAGAGLNLDWMNVKNYDRPVRVVR